MRILILAGGRGERLMPLTKHMPKPLVPIHGVPFLGYLLEHYAEHDIVLSIGYKAEQIKKYCKRQATLVEFVEEKTPLGTSGAVKYAAPFLKEQEWCAIINGDTWVEEDLDVILAWAKSQQADMVKVTGVNMLNGNRQDMGIYLVKTKLLDMLSSKGTPLQVDLCDLGKVFEYKSTHGYIDIGTHQGLRYCKEKMFGVPAFEEMGYEDIPGKSTA